MLCMYTSDDEPLLDGSGSGHSADLEAIKETITSGRGMWIYMTAVSKHYLK